MSAIPFAMKASRSIGCCYRRVLSREVERCWERVTVRRYFLRCVPKLATVPRRTSRRSRFRRSCPLTSFEPVVSDSRATRYARMTFDPSSAMGNGRCWDLKVLHRWRPTDVSNIRHDVDLREQGDMAMSKPTYVRFFSDFDNDDVPLVGGKNASLGEMFQKLSDQGVRVPNGFAITSAAYRYVLEESGAVAALHQVLDDLVPSDINDLARRAKRAREIVYGAAIPKDLAAEILDAYRRLQDEYGEAVSLAVRSSATAEDLPPASFAGQQETFLNVHGEESLLDACRRCFASLFTDRSIHYRVDQGFDHFDVALSIGVMKMVRSDLASSGVMFSLDTESGFRNVVFITGAYGLGENVVQGAVDPDEFYVQKPTLALGHRAVLRRLLGDKAVKMIFLEGETRATTRNVPTPKNDRERFCLSDEDVLELADNAVVIEIG